jgi:hypothetical protein
MGDWMLLIDSRMIEKPSNISFTEEEVRWMVTRARLV